LKLSYNLRLKNSGEPGEFQFAAFAACGNTLTRCHN